MRITAFNFTSLRAPCLQFTLLQLQLLEVSHVIDDAEQSFLLVTAQIKNAKSGENFILNKKKSASEAVLPFLPYYTHAYLSEICD